MIAALFVDPKGIYSGLPGVEIWGEARDARLYAGPWPVVAHPPCARWCRLAGLVQARWGYRKGDDSGCFASALASVRRWGGVLEHPAHSDAWDRYELPVPPRHGGWVRDFDGGWACQVEQGRYGHPAKKATWLYAFGVSLLPSLAWGFQPDSGERALIGGLRHKRALVSWCGNHTKVDDKRPRVGKAAASATPITFRDVLIEIARSTYAAEKPDRLTMSPTRFAGGKENTQ
jgi:hypothetical protein